jgi:cytoskeleton protein RodZ
MADSDEQGAAPPAEPPQAQAAPPPAQTAPPLAEPPLSAEPALSPEPPPPETVGSMLRNARLAQDLTVEQLSAELRIEAKQLVALEGDQFEQIGVPVFIKGYLKQYGTRLGLDFRDLLAQYYKQTTLTDIQVQPSRTIKLRDDRQITSWLVAGILLLAVIVGLAVWWWNGGTLTALPALPPSAPQTAVEPAAPAPASPPQVEPAVQAPPAPVAAPPPAVEPVAAPASVTAPAVEPAAANAEPASAADNVRAVPVTAIPLEFTFDQESTAEVTDGRGERLLWGVNAAGRRVTVRGEPPFAITLGNADAVRLTVDGAPYTIPTVGREGSLARFSVDVAEE